MTIEILDGMHALGGRYDAWLCDVWGVVHNGSAPFPGAIDALTRFRRDGGHVILLTNAPRPAGPIRAQLAHLGVPESAFDAVITSGDSTRFWLKSLREETVFHLGPARDIPLFEDLDLTIVGEADEPSVVLCTGLDDDETETPDDYLDRLKPLQAAGARMMCANPDLVVDRGGKLVYCAGALARVYVALGGSVVYAGKPHGPIYDLAYERLADITGQSIPKRRIAVIGDGMPTDIAGAGAQGLDAVFVVGGIHAADVNGADGAIDRARLADFLKRSGTSPTAVLPELCW